MSLTLKPISTLTGPQKAQLVGTASEFSLARRANLAVGAHIRHTYTNYDELLNSNSLSRAAARRGVEQFTLQKLVSWLGDEDDDDPIIEDILQEVVVISDDEGDLLPERNQKSDPSVRDVNAEGYEATAIDLTLSDDDEDLEDNDNVYVELSSAESKQNAEILARNAREGDQRHAKWEEALKLQRQNPMPADTRNDSHSQHQFALPISQANVMPIPGLDSYNRSIMGAAQTPHPGDTQGHIGAKSSISAIVSIVNASTHYIVLRLWR